MGVLSMATVILAGGTGVSRSAHSEAPAEQLVWRTLGSWSGHGSMQTESFLVETGVMRVRWETRKEEAPRRGTFRLVLQSAVSGRPLTVAAEQPGMGHGEAFVTESMRPSYMLVESSDVDWAFTLEEAQVLAVKK